LLKNGFDLDTVLAETNDSGLAWHCLRISRSEGCRFCALRDRPSIDLQPFAFCRDGLKAAVSLMALGATSGPRGGAGCLAFIKLAPVLMRSMVVAEGYQHNKIFVSFDEIVRHERSEYARDLRTPCRATFIRDLPFQDGVKRLGLGFEFTRLARKKSRDLNRVGYFQGAILRCALATESHSGNGTFARSQPVKNCPHMATEAAPITMTVIHPSLSRVP
jgi:hypothetical protein